VLYHDLFDIEATGSAGNKIGYYELDVTNIATSIYTTALWRYKTSSATIKAKIELIFTAGTQTILDESDSTTWAHGHTTVTAAKTLDKIRLYANQDTGHVYYDFALICQGIGTFPQWHVLQPELPNRYADIEIPGRVGDITQYLGMRSPTIRLEGPMDTSTAWGTPDGEYLYRLFHEAHTDPWQWFTSDLINCKVTPRAFSLKQEAGSGYQRLWTATFQLYSLSSGSETTWSDLQWLGL